MLARDPLARILADPAHAVGGAVLQGGVLPRPTDRLLGRVDMGDRPAGARGDETGDAGVAEQVQHSTAGRAVLKPRGEPFPVGRLFGEDAKVPKAAQPREERRLPPAHGPCLRHVVREAPSAGFVLVGRLEGRVGLRPSLRVAGPPEGLRLGPRHRHVAVALQLAAFAAVDQGVVGPRLGAKRQGLGSHARPTGRHATAHKAAARPVQRGRRARDPCRGGIFRLDCARIASPPLRTTP